MGYIKHDAVVVTASDIDHATVAKKKATDLNLETTDIVVSRSNGYASFCITPDGSKEGWPASDAAENARQDWIMWATTAAGLENIYIDWVSVRFGGDDEYCTINHHSD